MLDHELLDDYRRQLQEWVKVTGMAQKDLCQFTPWFHFGDAHDGRPMEEDTFSKTIRSALPSRSDGKRNLYRILGVLVLQGGISGETEVRQFLDHCRILPPEGRTWASIWRCIEAGVERYEADMQRSAMSPPALAAKPMISGARNAAPREFSRVAIAAALVVVVAAGLMIFLRAERTPLTAPPTTTLMASDTPVEAQASFGPVIAADPGPTCEDSILQIEISLTAVTRDFASSDVMGLMATDANGTVVVARLLFFSVPGTVRQPLAVNLNHLHPMEKRPLTIRLYDTSYLPDLTPGFSSEASYEFIQSTGTLLAEITLDPADYFTACAALPGTIPSGPGLEARM